MNDTRLFRRFVSRAGLIATALLSGCIGSPANPAATQPATQADPATTQPMHWLNQPAVEVAYDYFDPLWTAAESVAHDYQFELDRVDYRRGLLTTRPMVSKQFFEFWRKDAATGKDVAESSLATIRRSIRFEFSRENGRYFVQPKALVERYSAPQRRVTAVVRYRRVLPAPASGYRYPTGRDRALEQALASAIQEKLR